jgi:hypothetical protein
MAFDQYTTGPRRSGVRDTRVEVFGSGYSGEERFVTGPFAGFTAPTGTRRPPS